MDLDSTIFNEDAELYDRMRPRYSDYIFEEIKKHTRINGNSRVLEVGCGTGQATTSLAKITKNITCIDPGDKMIEIARKHLPELKYVVTSLEEYDSHSKFDLILSATAWHWIDPSIGYKKAHRLLVEEGYLAILHNFHSAEDPGAFHQEADPIYIKYGAKSRPSITESKKAVNRIASEIDNNFFQAVYKVEEKWQQTYTIDEYLALRNTYSDHRSMAKNDRIMFENELRNLANAKFGGSITKNYVCVLYLAKSKPLFQV